MHVSPVELPVSRLDLVRIAPPARLGLVRAPIRALAADRGALAVDRGAAAVHDGPMLPRLAAAALVAASLALAQGGCGKRSLTCDEAKLAATIDALERDGEAVAAGAEARAIDGLAAACPRLHPGFVAGLRATYTDARTGTLEFFGEPSFVAARRRVCADPEAWSREVPEAPPEDRARALYDACGFARLGVLDDGEPVIADDVEALFFLAALERDGVDPTLLRRLGRGLMTSVASAPRARRRCVDDPRSDACVRAVAALGIEAPPTTARRGHSGLPTLILGVDAALWDGEPIATLVDGRADGERRRALADAVTARTRAYQAANSERSDLRLAIAVDRRVPHATVIEALHAATLAELLDYTVVAGSRRGLASIVASVPYEWIGAADGRGEPPPVVVIDGDQVHFQRYEAPPITVAIDRLAELTTHAAAERARSDRRAVVVRARGTTPFEAVVAVLDALRGPECDVDREDDRGCFLALPILDQEPRYPRRPGRWDALELAIGAVNLEEGAPRGLTEAALRDELRPHLDDLARCLRDDEVARAVMPSRLSIHYGEADRARAAFVFGHSQHRDLPACVQEAIGRPPLPPQAFPAHGSVEVEVRVPIDEEAARRE